MPRRSIPSDVLDDLAFPVRVKLRVPDVGLGPLLLEILHWLRSEVGQENFAYHEAEVLRGDGLALHFRRLTDAAALFSAFPRLRLADDTGSREYHLAKVTRKLAS